MKMQTSRPLLIPQKRPLLAPKATPKTLNTNTPSPKATLMHRPSPPSTTNHSPNSHTEPKPTPEPESSHNRQPPTRTQLTRLELSFAAYPQPFLDPPTWEAMIRRARKGNSSASHTARICSPAPTPTTSRGLGVRGERAPPRARVDQRESPSTPETADQQRRRREREVEYGAMAIADRSRGGSGSGRGRRGRRVS